MEVAVNYGIITLLPPVFVIIFALFTKRTFEALILGGILAFVISDGIHFFTPYMDAVYGTLTDADTVWIILACGMFGSLIALLEKSRGSIGFSRVIAKYANSPKKSLLASFALGIIIFIDDYLNVLTIGSSMRTVCDDNKVPREMLAYVIASTGAADCTIIPFSTWVVFFAGVFGNQAELAQFGTGMEIYHHIMFFIFYGWTCLLVVPLVICGVIPIFGPMKKAYNRVATTGAVYSTDSAKYNTNVEEDDSKSGNMWFFILPILVLIGVTIVKNDLLLGVIFGILTAIVMYLPTRAMSFSEISDAVLGGFAQMIPMLAIIVAALTIKTCMQAIALPEYIINAVLPFMTPSIFPALTFFLVAGLAFITGSNWGIPAVTVPILVPLALAGDANVYLTLAAIVSGGVFGSHACFYSDCTVLTSSASRIEVMEHNLTQIPYAVISAICAFILFLIFGLLNIPT